MSENVNAYRILMGKFEAKKRYQDLIIDGPAILKRISKTMKDCGELVSYSSGWGKLLGCFDNIYEYFGHLVMLQMFSDETSKRAVSLLGYVVIVQRIYYYNYYYHHHHLLHAGNLYSYF